MLSRTPCLATVVSDANHVSRLPVTRAASCGAERAAWPKVSAYSAIQNRGAMRERICCFLYLLHECRCRLLYTERPRRISLRLDCEADYKERHGQQGVEKSSDAAIDRIQRLIALLVTRGLLISLYLLFALFAGAARLLIVCAATRCGVM